MSLPTDEEVQKAMTEIAKEDDERLREARIRFQTGKTKLGNVPSHHPDHKCGLHCDGQDGASSFCARLRRKLGLS